jgi:hypothetical protein
MNEITWAGFHSWAYAKERPTKVVAWDGPGTGGHIPLEGAPKVAFRLWAGLLFLSAAGCYVVARHTGRNHLL